MERPRAASMWLLLFLSLVLRNLDPCASINDEGRALLMFRERVEHDPYAALSNWVAGEDTADPCNWFGVHCENGDVVALNLKDLFLRGTLAPELGKLIHLKSLVLRNNSFSGTIPKELGLCKNLEVLDLENNDFSGPLPFNLWNIVSLDFLKRLQDSMPPKLYDLSMQSELEVDGSMPSSIERSTTRTHGISPIRRLLKKNRKKKKRPHGPSPAPSPSFPPALPSSPKASPHPPPVRSPAPSPSTSSPTPPLIRDNSSSTSNFDPSAHARVPEVHHSPNGSPAPPRTVSIQSPPPSGSPITSSKNHMALLIGVGIGSFSLVAFLVTCIHFYRGKKVVTVKPWTTGLSGQLQKAFVTGVPLLKRSELETACEDFSNIIGSLSDCILYKGTLSSGVEIAVASTLITSVKNWSKHSETQFRNKIATLSKVNHKNFVNLLGYCEEEEPFTRIMVFEYAPNGTLFEHLHVKEAEDLDWAARLRIGMGIAYCLEHMHQLNSPVILENLQSSSIYLTDDLAAKISDFDFSSETTATKAASGNSGPLSKQTPRPEGIVYKFGILLLEIITGRLPYSEENGLLSDWASDYLRGSSQLRDIADPSLKTLRDGDVRAFCEVIRRCCNPEPQERPTMEEVAARLRGITDVTPVGAVPRSSPLWWAELEILSTEAN